MVTFAVQLRNRRKWVRSSESGTRVQSYAGVDTFRISCWVQYQSGEGFVYPHGELIEALKAEVERLRKGNEPSGTIEFRGELLSVQRRGAGTGDGEKRGPYYPYVVTWRGIRFQFQPFAEATGNVPNLIVYASSTPLIAKRGDWEAIWDEARYFVESVLLGQITKTVVGRVDVFVDLPGQTPGAFYEAFQRGQFVRRSRKWDLHTVGGAVTAELVRSIVEAGRDELAVSVHASGQHVTGLVLGSGSAITCTLYDKLRELDDAEAVVKFESMRAAYWGGEVPEELCRIEWRVPSRQLKEAGITDVQSLRDQLRNLANWLCQSWVTVRADGVDRNHASRTAFDPGWQRVVDTVAARFGGEWNTDARLVPAAVERGGLLAQAVGCLSSYLVENDFPGDEAELVEHVVDAVLEGLNRVGVSTAFDRLKRKVLEHAARVTNAWRDLQRGPPSSPVARCVGHGARWTVCDAAGEDGASVGGPDADRLRVAVAGLRALDSDVHFAAWT